MQSMSIICEAEKSADDLADRIIPITLFRFPEHQATKKAVDQFAGFEWAYCRVEE